MKFKGDIIITDPCYIIKKDSEDWRKCDYGDNMAALGLTNYISESTRYGEMTHCCILMEISNVQV